MIGDPVLKKPTVALALCGGRLESKRKLYIVPKRMAFAFGFWAKVSEFQVIALGGLVRSPRRVAESRVSRRFHRWETRDDSAGREIRCCSPLTPPPSGHTEGLNRAIEVLIMDGVFIMPNAGGRVRHFVGDERTAIDSRRGLDRTDGRAGPGTGRRNHSHRGADRRKGETRRAGDIVATIGGIVIHVALTGMGLAPGVFLRAVVLHFSVISRARDSCVVFKSWHSTRTRCEVRIVSMAGVVLGPWITGKAPVKGLTQAREPRHQQLFP